MPDHPVRRLDAVGCRKEFGDPPPGQAHHAERDQHRDAGGHAAAAQCEQCESQDREQQVERDLDRETPHLGQARGQRQRDKHLRERQIGEPHRRVGALRLGQQGQHDDHDDEIGGPDAHHPVAQVATYRRVRRVIRPARTRPAVCARHPRPPQQKPRQREEQCDGEIESAQDRADHRQRDGTRLERDVRGEHPERGNRAHALELRKESARRATRRRGDRRRRWLWHQPRIRTFARRVCGHRTGTRQANSTRTVVSCPCRRPGPRVHPPRAPRPRADSARPISSGRPSSFSAPS